MNFFKGFQIPGRAVTGKNRTRIRTNSARSYPGFCAGKQEASRRVRQMTPKGAR